MPVQSPIGAHVIMVNDDRMSVTSKPARAVFGRVLDDARRHGKHRITDAPKQIDALMLANDRSILDASPRAKRRNDRAHHGRMCARL
jgi:hypothetical protein